MARKKTSTKSKTTKKRKRKSKVKRRTWDPVKVAEKLAPNVALAIGLDVLGLTEDEYVELLRDILVSLIGDRVTKPKADTLIKAIKRNEKKIMSLIAAKLLEIIPEGKLTPEQVEFVVSYIGPLVLPFAQRLYREAKRVGVDLGPLQAAWEEAWRLRGDEGPVGYCPQCGFRSVAPDATCMVCGKLLNDDELRVATDFDAKFKAFLEEASCNDLKKALSRGSLYVSHTGVSVEPVSKWDIEIFLKRKEREAIRDAIASRC